MRAKLASFTHPRLLLIAVFAMLLSGCTMRTFIDIDVESDGSGLFQVTMAFDEELRSLLEQDSEQPIDWNDPTSFSGEDSPAEIVHDFPEGTTIDPYSADGFEGFIASIEFDSLEELDQLLAETSGEGEEAFPFHVTSDGQGRFELTTDGDVLASAQPFEEDTEFFDPSMLSSLFDVKLRVSFPGEVVSTNADQAEDGVMVWNLDVLAEDQVEPAAVSEVTSSLNLGLLALIALLVIAAGGAAFLLVRRGSDDPSEPADVDASVAEEAPNPV
ncbi:MAG TPA: hypothetical protein VHL52_07475 [Acidimicrobiia bacterium]|nr:hypothetical protein [Acidimicrobiia bacterium]